MNKKKGMHKKFHSSKSIIEVENWPKKPIKDFKKLKFEKKVLKTSYTRIKDLP